MIATHTPPNSATDPGSACTHDITQSCPEPLTAETAFAAVDEAVRAKAAAEVIAAGFATSELPVVSGALYKRETAG